MRLEWIFFEVEWCANMICKISSTGKEVLEREVALALMDQRLINFDVALKDSMSCERADIDMRQRLVGGWQGCCNYRRGVAMWCAAIRCRETASAIQQGCSRNVALG